MSKQTTLADILTSEVHERLLASWEPVEETECPEHELADQPPGTPDKLFSPSGK